MGGLNWVALFHETERNLTKPSDYYRQMRYKNVSNSNISIPLFHTYSLTPVNGNTHTFFFQHLASKLQECSSQPVTGSDQEKAMCKAMHYAFPSAAHLTCTRHMRGNAEDRYD